MLKQQSNNDSQLPHTRLLALVSIHLPQNQVVEIAVYKDSSIDSLVDDAIRTHKLNPRAKIFIKGKIQEKLFNVLPHTNANSKLNAKAIESQYVSGGSERTRMNDEDMSGSKSNFEFKRLRKGDIDKSKINFQKMPLAESSTRSLFLSQKNKTKSKINKKVPKADSLEKENLSYLESSKKLRLSTEGSQANPCSPPTPIFFLPKEEAKMRLSEKQNFHKLSEDPPKLEKTQSIKMKKTSIKVNKQYSRLKTEGQNLNFCQYNLRDLQKEMHQQIITLKMQKKVRSLEPELYSIFGSITKYNPTFIENIHPKYARFDELSQKFAKALCEFLELLTENEMQNLNFETFKACIVKYRSQNILQALK